jgi:hypothetical protein
MPKTPSGRGYRLTGDQTIRDEIWATRGESLSAEPNVVQPTAAPELAFRADFPVAAPCLIARDAAMRTSGAGVGLPDSHPESARRDRERGIGG